MNTRSASLGMYDHPRQRAANDRLWGEIARIVRARGVRDVPIRLDRGRPVQEIWRDPDLLLAQACGYPLVADPALALLAIAIPIYDAPDCANGQHLSYFVARSDDDAAGLANFRDRRAAINDRESNTGLNLFRAAVAGLAGGQSFFENVVETGSHRGSIAAILDDVADIAAIDAVTYAAITRFEPDVTALLRIVGVSAASPAPPFVTARATSPEVVAALRIALAAVTTDPGLADARAALFLRHIAPCGNERYEPLRHIEAAAVAAHYPDLS